MRKRASGNYYSKVLSLPKDHAMAYRNSQAISLPISFLWELVPEVNAEDF